MVYQANLIDYEKTIGDFSASKPGHSRMKKRDTTRVMYKRSGGREAGSESYKFSGEYHSRIELRNLSKHSLVAIMDADPTNTEDNELQKSSRRQSIPNSSEDVSHLDSQRKVRSIQIGRGRRGSQPGSELLPQGTGNRQRFFSHHQGDIRHKSGTSSITELERSSRERNDDTTPNDLLDIVKDEFWLKNTEEPSNFPVPVIFEVDRFRIDPVENAAAESSNENENANPEIKVKEALKMDGKAIIPQEAEESSYANSSSDSDSSSSSSD